jgi:hypothetical protein
MLPVADCKNGKSMNFGVGARSASNSFENSPLSSDHTTNAINGSSLDGDHLRSMTA